jgi:PAS domain S-box-containing protein
LEKALARWENEGGRVQQHAQHLRRNEPNVPQAASITEETAPAAFRSGPLPYKAVIAAALDPIITIDSTGIIQSVSDSVHRVFGWTPAELVGRNVSVLMPEPHCSAHDGYIACYHATGRTEHLNRARRFEAVRKDGTFFPIEVCVARVDLAGVAAPLFVGIIRDMSQLSKAGGDILPGDAALAATLDHNQLHELLAEQTSALHAAHLRLRMADRMASIGALAAGLGHDMNNVLLPVRAHLNAAQALAMIPEVRDHVEAVQESVAYLQQLADGLHFLALDTDSEVAAGTTTDLREWWSHVGPLLSKAVPRHVKVVVSLPKGLPKVGISPHALTQAVLNLVVNAGQAIPLPSPSTSAHRDRKQRQGLVRIHAQRAERGAQVRLGVTDNGVGMSPEVQRNAFEMFYTTKTRGLGTGLGLPLVARVVGRARGSVHIESELGKGTTVELLLPIASHEAQPSSRLAAVITLTDERAAILVQNLLEDSGVRTTLGTDPMSADIWIAEPENVQASHGKTWRKRHPQGVLVLYGKPSNRSARSWKSLHPLTIDDPDDLDAIRAALSRAVSR